MDPVLIVEYGKLLSNSLQHASPRPCKTASRLKLSVPEMTALVGGRGLHSFRFQLNLSSSVHRVTHFNPECVLELLKLSSNVNQCKPLVGGLRTLDANTGGSKLGVFTASPGTLSNDFFIKLLDMDTVWTKRWGAAD